MAKSSYEYAMRSLETQVEEENGVKEMIIAAYEASGGTYGYRRILHQVRQDGLCGLGEWTSRRLMMEFNSLVDNKLSNTCLILPFPWF